MTAILICWALAGLIGWFGGKLLKQDRDGEPEKEEGAGVCESAWLLPIMQEAFRRAAPNSRGRGSRDYMNLSTIIQKLEAGEDVAPGVCSYLLEKIGAGDLAEQIKGAGA